MLNILEEGSQKNTYGADNFAHIVDNDAASPATKGISAASGVAVEESFLLLTSSTEYSVSDAGAPSASPIRERIKSA